MMMDDSFLPSSGFSDLAPMKMPRGRQHEESLIDLSFVRCRLFSSSAFLSLIFSPQASKIQLDFLTVYVELLFLPLVSFPPNFLLSIHSFLLSSLCILFFLFSIHSILSLPPPFVAYRSICPEYNTAHS